MRISTEPVKPIVGTICSALIENEQGQILVSETEHGISMLGGYVDWSRGFPKCLEDKVREEYSVEIKLRGIRGVYQNHTPSGS